MKDLLNKFRSNMSINVIGGLVVLLSLFGLFVWIIGNHSFTNAFKNEYATVTYHMADSVVVLIDGDHLDDYLAGKKREEYIRTKEKLDVSCEKLNVSLIYVIKVDQSDYGRFVSVFNSVNNAVDNSEYTEWELGHKRDTTNDEYRQKYKALYEDGSPYETVFRMHTTDGQHPHITTIVPVKNSKNEVVALMCMQRPVREMADAMRPYVLLILLGAVVMVILISLLSVSFLRNSVIRPIEKVSKEASRFAKEGTKGVPLEGLGRYDVIQDLADSIDSMETDTINYIDNLTMVTAERVKMNAELSISASIQKGSIPDVFPAFPDRDEFDIYASMDPAREVGGDFYNFFLIDDDHLAVVIADVSGKGIPAALFMMVINILLTDRALMGGTPAQILSYVNENICMHNPEDMFVTVWLGILEISTGRLTYANAGHDDPAIYHKGSFFEINKEKHGFVLAVMPGSKYEDRELQLSAGDKIFLYTDGVTEATDNDKKLYGTDRMLEALNECKEGSPEEVLVHIKESVNGFVGDAPQFDDLTMLCLEMKK